MNFTYELLRKYENALIEIRRVAMLHGAGALIGGGYTRIKDLVDEAIKVEDTEE